MNSLDNKKLGYFGGLIAITIVLIGSFGAYGFISIRDALKDPVADKIVAGAVKEQLGIKCDDSLWQHVYAGDPHKFKVPQDRLKIIFYCLRVTGKLMSATQEKDGDWHLRLDVDNKIYLNAKNISGQHGYLVLEPVCSNPVTQSDTLKEKVCNGFRQNIFDKSMLQKRVEVIGSFVLDEEHGWLELHPITSIKIIK